MKKLILATALLSLTAVAAEAPGVWAKPPKEAWKAELLKQPVRAFCVDFNWQIQGNNCWFAAPGHWADADPAAQVNWCKAAGVNCIQTFALSCNGYAWYKGGPVPEQPGLKSDFLTEVVRLGHQQKMLVMGYYCIGANTLWGKNHPDQSYGTPAGGMHIPFTKEYVAYLCASVEDALKKTDMDGFMLDWMSNTSGKWLECEKTMYAELMGVPFPGADKITPTDQATFDRKAVERCWTSIRDTARRVKPECILWPNGLHHLNLEGTDWLLNEGPDVNTTAAVMKQLNGKPIRLIQNQVGWANHDARKVFSKTKYASWDFYGFAAPYDNGLPLPVADYLGKPVDEFKGVDRMTINDRNIAALVRFYTGREVKPQTLNTGLATDKPAKASGTWGAGYEAENAFDGDSSTRWGAEPNAHSAWLEVDLGKPVKIRRAIIENAYPELKRIRTFVIETWQDGQWKACYQGKDLGEKLEATFEPVTAQRVRLNITEATDTPTLWEFQVLE
jgi:hypothetical protein